MSKVKLHQGVWARQAFHGKKKVRITFLPDNSAHETESILRLYDEGEKQAWEHLLGPIDLEKIDIDKGITILRFNKDSTGGVATFLPSGSKRDLIIHPFQGRVEAGGVGAGAPEFYQCVADNREALGLATALIHCLPNWPL